MIWTTRHLFPFVNLNRRKRNCYFHISKPKPCVCRLACGEITTTILVEHKHNRLRARSAMRKLQGAMRSQCYNSRNSAHLCVYHTSLRPSSTLEPRHSPLSVTFKCIAEADALRSGSRVEAAQINRSKVVQNNSLPPDGVIAFVESVCLKVRMILPQVHLRKPCYDFSFL